MLNKFLCYCTHQHLFCLSPPQHGGPLGARASGRGGKFPQQGLALQPCPHPHPWPVGLGVPPLGWGNGGSLPGRHYVCLVFLTIKMERIGLPKSWDSFILFIYFIQNKIISLSIKLHALHKHFPSCPIFLKWIVKEILANLQSYKKSQSFIIYIKLRENKIRNIKASKSCNILRTICSRKLEQVSK